MTGGPGDMQETPGGGHNVKKALMLTTQILKTVITSLNTRLGK